MRVISGQSGWKIWFPLAALLLISGCAFGIQMSSYGQRGTEVPGVSPVQVRLLQLKKRFDFPQRLSPSSFNLDDPTKLGAELESYLAEDPDNPKAHTQAIMTLQVPPSGIVQVAKFARLKGANFLLAVALPSKLGGKRGANWIDQWEYPPKWHFWRSAVRVCVDTYDVFIECEFYKLRVRGSFGSEQLRVRVFPLQQTGGWVKWTWQSFITGIPEGLRPLLADPADFSVGAAEFITPNEETIYRRVVRGTRYVLLVATNLDETRGGLGIAALDTSTGMEVTFDLGPLH